MSALDILIPRLKVAEGFKANAYKDILGKWTIGYGFCIDAGLTEHSANALLFAQAQEVQTVLQASWWFQGLDDVRASVMLEIAFNAGVAGLLLFKHMLTAVSEKRWQAAHDELLDSDAARMLPARYGRLAELLLKGE